MIELKKMTTVELENLKKDICFEIDHRSQNRQEELWNNVKLAILEYVKYYDIGIDVPGKLTMTDIDIDKLDMPGYLFTI